MYFHARCHVLCVYAFVWGLWLERLVIVGVMLIYSVKDSDMRFSMKISGVCSGGNTSDVVGDLIAPV